MGLSDYGEFIYFGSATFSASYFFFVLFAEVDLNPTI